MRCPAATSGQVSVNAERRHMPRTDRAAACARSPSSTVSAYPHSPRQSGRNGFDWAIAGLMTCCLLVLVGCERTESVQWGERGTSMIHVDKPSRLLSAADIHGVPPPEPRDPPDPDIPLAKDVNENVQVLTDLDALEFARLMQAISTWVAPEEGCEYCHNTENLASDEKYTKVISRQMLQMTRDINANWKSHVADTGVTCWTCHRGQAVPSGTWFTDPGPKTPSAGITGVKAGQNTAGIQAIGNASLPFDPLTPFLDGDAQISVQGTTALPSGNLNSIKKTEWTYALMMYMSNSLGVNCTYCHQTRAMGVWEESTPQRVTAWHGIRMVRDLNGDYLNPLKPLYPPGRLGPTGDAPKVACDTCHKGAFKPLLGVSMLGDYPELAGYRTERPGAVAEAVAESEAVAEVIEPIEEGALISEPDGSVAETAPETAPEPVQESAPEVAGEAVPEIAPEVADVIEAAEVAPAQTEAEADVEAAAEVPLEAMRLTAGKPAVEETPTPDWAAKFAEIDSVVATLREELKSASEERLALRSQLAAVDSAPVAGDVGIDVETLRQSYEAARAEADRLAAEVEQLRAGLPERTEETEVSKQPAAALEEAERRAVAAEAKVGSERTALLQQLEVVRSQRDAAVADAEGAITEASSRHTAALSQIERRLAAAEARLQQERTALQQQLRVVRAQRDSSTADAEARMAALIEESAEKRSAALRAAQAKLDQERTAMQQQLAVVRSQRDAARADTDAQIGKLTEEHAAALRAAEARLDQERTALRQQLVVVRAQRDAVAADAERQVAKLTEERAAALRAAGARLEQERLALQQQLGVVRSQRDAVAADAEKRVAKLAEERAAALRAAGARLEQERLALQQQLAVVRAQRDAALEDTESESRIASLTEEVDSLRAKIAETEGVAADLRAQMQAAASEHTRQLAETKGSIARMRTLYEGVSEVGGRVTDEGILVNLGGEELQFASGSAILPARELPTLDRVAELLASRGDLKAKIGGHTDSLGDPQINQALSRQRAEAVMQALIDRGVDPSRLSTEGYGADRPVADNTTDRGRRQNRRVEIVMIDETGGGSAVVGE
jgi:outer membrane protein OmpA-like peptidoglycan-associated protein